MQIQSTSSQPISSSKKATSKKKIESKPKSTLKAPKDLSTLSKEPKLSGASSQQLNGFSQNFGSKSLPAIPDGGNKGIGLQPDPKSTIGTPYDPKKNSGIGLQQPPDLGSWGVPYEPKNNADGGKSPVNGPISLPGGPVDPVPGFPSGGGPSLPGAPVDPMPPVPGFPSGGNGPSLPGAPVDPLPPGFPGR